jgi:hypothetical protein
MPRNPYLDQVPKQEFPLTSYYLQDKLSMAGGGSSVSASYADTASYTPNAVVTASLLRMGTGEIIFIKGDDSTFSITVDNVTSASYATTASYALNGGSGGSTFPYTGSAKITGSLDITGSFSVADSVGLPNIDSSTRTLYDSIGRHSASLDWDSRNLKDTSGTTVINWNSGLDLQSGTLKISTGENAVVGTAKLVSGCVLVSNTSVTAGSLIFLTTQIKGTVQPGALYIGNISASSSFEVSSSSNTDTSTFAYMIVN